MAGAQGTEEIEGASALSPLPLLYAYDFHVLLLLSCKCSNKLHAFAIYIYYYFYFFSFCLLHRCAKFEILFADSFNGTYSLLFTSSSTYISLCVNCYYGFAEQHRYVTERRSIHCVGIPCFVCLWNICSQTQNEACQTSL